MDLPETWQALRRFLGVPDRLRQAAQGKEPLERLAIAYLVHLGHNAKDETLLSRPP